MMATLMVLAIAGDIALPFGVVGHEGSTLLVVANGLRSSPTTSWEAANAPKIARPIRPELPVSRIFIESIHSKRPGTTGMLRF